MTSHPLLDTYRSTHRLLLMIAPSESCPAYRMQRYSLIRRTAGLYDRDLIVGLILATGESWLGEDPLSPEQAGELRDRFQVGPDEFCLILIGKDGTEKRREYVPVNPETFFQQIDAMPLRQREMSQRI